MANPYQFWNSQLAAQHKQFVDAYTQKQRSNSTSSNWSNVNQPASRVEKVRTHSIGGPFSAGVIFERDDGTPPSDDELIMVTVRVTSNWRRRSIEGCDELPSRPPPRSFIKRLGTRMNGLPDHDQIKALKMKRSDYRRYFARDRHGNYAGTEPERVWSESDLDREFAKYQDLPLRTILLTAPAQGLVC